jgi:hypothetical protein
MNSNVYGVAEGAAPTGGTTDVNSGLINQVARRVGELTEERIAEEVTGMFEFPTQSETAEVLEDENQRLRDEIARLRKERVKPVKRKPINGASNRDIEKRDRAIEL